MDQYLINLETRETFEKIIYCYPPDLSIKEIEKLIEEPGVIGPPKTEWIFGEQVILN